MATTKVKATFKGLDGSLGFKKGATYELEVSQEFSEYRKSIFVKEDVTYNRRTGTVEYQTVIGFLNNWEDIK